MATDIDIPPVYDTLIKKGVQQNPILSDIWMGWFSTFYQTLIEYISSSGIFLPILTTVERDAIGTPINGQMIYNITVNAPQIYQNGVWKTFTTT